MGLWKTDGTASQHNASQKLRELLRIPFQDVFGDQHRIFFSAALANGRELWVSDGTLAAQSWSGTSFPVRPVRFLVFFREFGGQLLFSANGPSGRELWRSNGSSFNTFQVKISSRNKRKFT